MFAQASKPGLILPPMRLVPDKKQAAHAAECCIRGVAVLAGEDIIRGFVASVSYDATVQADKREFLLPGISAGTKMKKKITVWEGTLDC